MARSTWITPRLTQFLIAALILAALSSSVHSDRAWAHDTPANCIGVYHGGNQRGVACTHNSHQILDGCDRYVDGLKARAWEWGGTPFEPVPGLQWLVPDMRPRFWVPSRPKAAAGLIAATVATGLGAGLVSSCGAREAGAGEAAQSGRYPDAAPPAIRPDERVLARGTSSAAGPWEIRASTSHQIVYEGEEVQPAGLRCIMLVLLEAPPGTPRPGAGACGEFGRDGLGALEVPVVDRSGRVRVLLFGRAPEAATAVEVTAANLAPTRTPALDGPPDQAGNLWVLAVSPDLDNPRIDWINGDGVSAGVKLGVSWLMDRGRRLAEGADRGD